MASQAQSQSRGRGPSLGQAEGAEHQPSKRPKSVKDMAGRPKAAVFLVSLGSEISSEIFKHLREDEIETLTFEIARLDSVESEQTDQVLAEFQELMMASDFITSGGIDYARELERRRRIAEEKRAIEQSMLRENAIRQAEEQNIEVSMSVEERKRLELQEHAINMAKEHPEDVAQLIRTWLREE